MSGVVQALLAAYGAAKDAYFKYVTLLLPGNGTNGAQNNTFLDSSTNNFTITRNGNTTQGTFTPYGSNWSNYFDGSGDYLTAGTTSSFNFLHNTTALFTIEAWVYVTVGSSYNTIIDTNGAGSANIGCWFTVNNDNKLRVFITKSSSFNPVIDVSSSTTVPLNQWVHVAVTYDQSLASNNATFYINGVASGNGTKTANAPSSSNATYALQVGAYNTPSGYFNGYISNLRINNTIVYSGAFTPSTVPLTAITGTQLLTCQSNRFIDNSSNNFTITVNGDTSVQRFSPFNPTAPYAAGTIGGSGYFDGSGDYLVCGAASDWAFMSNSTALWSVEMWVYPTVLGSNDRTLLDTAQSTTANVGMAMQINANRTVQVEIYRGSTGTYVVTGDSTSTLVANQWNHILATYDQSLASQNLKFYINGGSAETANKTGNAPSSSNPNRAMTIATYGAGGGQFFTGYIGSMRISNVIRSSGVPTAPYTSDANTVLLTNYTNGGIIDNAMMNDLETVGNAQISTSVSKFGGGSMAFDGSGDYLNAPSSQAFTYGTGNFTIEGWHYLTAAASSTKYLFDQRVSGQGFFPAMYISGGQYVVYINSAISLQAGTVVANSWVHWALVKNGSTTSLYINGSSVGSFTDNNNYSSTAQFRIGSEFGATGSYDWQGYIDDLRITKGYARYTANFTAPTAAFPTQ